MFCATAADCKPPFGFAASDNWSCARNHRCQSERGRRELLRFRRRRGYVDGAVVGADDLRLTEDRR